MSGLRRTGLESEVADLTVKHALDDYGVESIKFNPLGETGIPDRWFLIPGGRPFIIEFKAPGCKDDPSPKQDWWIGKMKRLGYDVEVHDNHKTALRAIFRRVKKAMGVK